MRRRLPDLLHGPHLRLPRPVDALSEQWSALRPRMRMLAVLLLTVATLLLIDARVRAADARWGGRPVEVLVATRDLAPGEAPAALERMRFPPDVVPPGAVAEVTGDEVLAFAVPTGTVLTRRHLDPRGPAAGLAAGLQAVPVPAEPGWGLVTGGHVDVWVLAAGDTPATRVAAGRPVVHVREDPAGLTALIGLRSTEAQAVTSGLALGRILLTHAAADSSGATRG